MILFLTVVVPLLILWAVRIELVYAIRMRAIDDIFNHKDYYKLLYLLNKRSYEAMMLDLTRWTYTGFYPELQQ